ATPLVDLPYAAGRLRRSADPLGWPRGPGRVVVPLSEHEQRLFEPIERSLAEDPKFASAVRASDPRFHARRRVLLARGLLLIGLAVLIYGVAEKSPLLGGAGFVVMLASVAFAIQSVRRARHPELRVVGGPTKRTTRTRKVSFMDRLEERWRNRPENGG